MFANEIAELSNLGDPFFLQKSSDNVRLTAKKGDHTVPTPELKMQGSTDNTQLEEPLREFEAAEESKV